MTNSLLLKPWPSRNSSSLPSYNSFNMVDLSIGFFLCFPGRVPSGELTFCHGKIHHAINGKIHYFDWAIFNSKLLVHQAGYIPLNPIKPPFSYGFPMVFLWFYHFPMVFLWFTNDLPMIGTRGLAEEIGGHAADIEAASKEKQNATELRETTRSDFVATLKDPDPRDLPWGRSTVF